MVMSESRIRGRLDAYTKHREYDRKHHLRNMNRRLIELLEWVLDD